MSRFEDMAYESSRSNLKAMLAEETRVITGRNTGYGIVAPHWEGSSGIEFDTVES